MTDPSPRPEITPDSARPAPSPTGSDLQGSTSAEPATKGPDPKDPLRRSRTSGAFIAMVVLGLLLVLLIIFIAQNTQKVQVSFLAWEGTTPLAVAILIAAVAGILITSVAGLLRILQLRRRVKRS